MSEHEIELVEKEQKFSLAKFMVGWAKIVTSMSFLAWAVYTSLFAAILGTVFASGASDALAFLGTAFMLVLACGWVATTFVMAVNLQKGLETMFSNAKLSAEFKAGFSKDVSGKIGKE